MGIYSRYTATLLILFFSLNAYSAVRQSVNPSASSVIQNYTSADYQMPNGAINYYGPDKYYALDNSLNARAGDKIAPTIRPVASKVGVPSFPYGGGAVLRVSPIVDVTPSKTVPVARIGAGVKNLLKASPQAIAGTVAISAFIAGVDWAFDELTGQIVKTDLSPIPIDTQYYYWKPTTNAGEWFKSATALESAQEYVRRYNYSCCTYELAGVEIEPSNTTANVTFKQIRKSNGEITMMYTQIRRLGSGCPSYATYSSLTGACMTSLPSPVSDSDIDTLDFSGLNADHLTGLLRETCLNSPSPDNCFESMVESSALSGPSSVVGPSQVSVETKHNPDGSSTTTTTTTKTDYDITYNDNSFDVATKETTTVEVDGELASTTTVEDTSAPVDDPESPPQEDPVDYIFTDSPLPEVEPFYDAKYPDGIAGVWDSAMSDVSDSQFMQFLQSFIPSFSGSCPAFSLNLNISTWAAFGNFDFPSLCYVFDFIKIILLVTALFTARAITFGG